MNLKSLAIPFVTLSVVLISCSQHSEDQKNKTSSEEITVDSTINASESLSSDDNEVTYSLPSALQIAYVFKKSGAGFIPSLLNSKENSTKYNVSNYKRAVNFGIYSADLSYCLFNKKYQESKEYIKTCKEVGSALGLNQAFESDNMAQRFDKNITNEDSVIKIVSNIQLKTDLMLEQNKQKHITVIAFAGAWTESMFIATEVYTKGKNKKVLVSLMEQLLLSETVIKALKNYQTSEKEMPLLISSIEKIHSQFNTIASVKTAIEKDEEMDFNLMAVTENEINTITESIKVLRTSMID
jgi:tyrosyl-tRNA synthetase